MFFEGRHSFKARDKSVVRRMESWRFEIHLFAISLDRKVHVVIFSRTMTSIEHGFGNMHKDV